MTDDDLPTVTRDDIWRCVEADRDNEARPAEMDPRDTLHAAADLIEEGRAVADVVECILTEFGDAELTALAEDAFCLRRLSPTGELGRLLAALEAADTETTRRWVASDAYDGPDVARLIGDHAEALSLLRRAEAFIRGFEDDEAQDGIPDLLAAMRKALEGGA